MASLHHMTDDQLASEKIRNAVAMNSLEKTMDDQLTRLRNGDNVILFSLLESMIKYMRGLHRGQKLRDAQRW